MKRLLFILIFAVLISCKTEKASTNEVNSIEPISNKVLESAIIYEANIRQYSAEGTFNQFTKDIPQLKELGVEIIWLMPIFPISTTKSKGSLGSYYAVSDYTKVNPEFENLEDVKNLVKVAHDNDMYVILDWVANHTGWDHVWPLMKKLAQLKKISKALDGGKNAASYTRIKSSDDENILIFTREKEEDKIIFMANLSNKKITFTTEKKGKFLIIFLTKRIIFR